MFSVTFSTSSIVVLSLASVVFDRRAHRASADAQQMRGIVEAAQAGMLVCQGYLVVKANQTFALLVDIEQSEIEGRPLADFVAMPIPIEDRPDMGMRRAETFLTPTEGPRFEIEISTTLMTSGKASRTLIEVRDIRGQKQARDYIIHLANHDELTGLPNRRLFRAILRRAVENAANADREFGLLWIDLDRFKEVNDDHGHAAGDHLLCAVADRFRSVLGDQHLVARIGGDEFVVLTSDDPAVVAQRLFNAMSASISVQGDLLKVGLSIGLATFPCDGNSADTLMHLADCALYDAKKAGRKRCSSRAA